MKALVNLLIRGVELFEAEARELRDGVLRLGVGLGLLAVATLLTLGGCVLLLVAAFLALQNLVGSAGAAAIIGLIAFLIAGALLWLAHHHSRS